MFACGPNSNGNSYRYAEIWHCAKIFTAKSRGVAVRRDSDDIGTVTDCLASDLSATFCDLFMDRALCGRLQPGLSGQGGLD